MAGIINLSCLRIKYALDSYIRTNIIPSELRDGEFSVDDILRCAKDNDLFDQAHQDAINKLLADYQQKTQRNLVDIRKNLKAEYKYLLDSLHTKNNEFRFNVVLQRYRRGINPVTALYYETKQMLKSFDPLNEQHCWLLDLITDPVFNQKLTDAIAYDINQLQTFMNTYYWPIVNTEEDIPLVLCHAKNFLEDLHQYKIAFDSTNVWVDE